MPDDPNLITPDPNPTPPDPVIDPPADPPAPPKPSDLTPEEMRAMLGQQQELIRAQARALEEGSNRLQSIEAKLSKLSEPAPKAPAEQAKEFFDNPTTVTRDIVKEELKTAVQPLRDFVDGMRSESAYDKAKKSVKSDPKLKQVFEVAEDLIDAAMSQEGVQPTEAAFRATALATMGAIYAGFVPGRTLGGAPPPPPNGDPAVPHQPSHVRPSAPPPPAPPKAKEPELTENQRRLAREAGLTPAQYVAYMNMEPTDVASKKLSEVK